MGRAADPLTESWTPEEIAALEALQTWADGSAELNHHLSRWTGLPTSDTQALGVVTWAAQSGSPLSPAELARRIGMTSGATTTLVSRLERGGLVVRSRESTDRRRVTLRPTDDGRERVRSFTAFAGAEIAAAVRGTDPAELRAATAFVARMGAAVAAANERLHRHGRRSAADAPPTDEPAGADAG